MTMTKLLSPVTGAYLLEPAPDMLHQDATQWLSDLEFYKTELAFLAKILNIAFLRVSSQQQLRGLKSLENKVKLFSEHSLDKLHEQVIRHENHLSELSEDKFKKNRKAVIEEHQAQFGEMRTFSDDVRDLKKEIFAVVENQLKRTKTVTGDLENGKLVF